MLDRRLVDQKTSGEQMEDEGVEYRRASGVGETEQLDEIRGTGRGLLVQ